MTSHCLSLSGYLPCQARLAGGFSVVLWLALAQGLVAQGPFREESPGVRTSEPQTISTGFVLIDGAYVAPPYRVEQQDGEVRINDLVVSTTRGGERQRDEPRRANRQRLEESESFVGLPDRLRGRRPAWWGREARARRQFLHVVWALRENSMVLAFSDQQPLMLDAYQAARILMHLLEQDDKGDGPPTADDLFFGQLTTQQWQQTLTHFQPTEELRERATALVERHREGIEFDEQATKSAKWYQALASQPARYGVTVTAMGLAVLALGNLLLYRPQTGGRWNDIHDGQGEGMNMRRIVLILALLCLFDLLRGIL